MSFYEHTIVARQDASSKQLADFEDKYSNILKDHSGKLIKLEKWGLINFARKIKKFNKGHFLHYKVESESNSMDEIKKKIKLDKIVIKDLVIKYKKLDLKTEYFKKDRWWKRNQEILKEIQILLIN